MLHFLPVMHFCSMGGSVAVHVASRKVVRSVAGLVVVDVVEVCFTTGTVYTVLTDIFLLLNATN